MHESNLYLQVQTIRWGITELNTDFAWLRSEVSHPILCYISILQTFVWVWFVHFYSVNDVCIDDAGFLVWSEYLNHSMTCAGISPTTAHYFVLLELVCCFKFYIFLTGFVSRFTKASDLYDSSSWILQVCITWLFNW